MTENIHERQLNNYVNIPMQNTAIFVMIKMSGVMMKQCDSIKISFMLKYEVEESYYICSENNGSVIVKSFPPSILASGTLFRGKFFFPLKLILEVLVVSHWRTNWYLILVN